MARPLIDLGATGVWAPQSMLVSRATFPSNLYYVGMKWGKPFADNVGVRVEQYVGLQLRLLGGDHVEGEIEHARGQKSVDSFWVIDQAVILFECKSARMTQRLQMTPSRASSHPRSARIGRRSIAPQDSSETATLPSRICRATDPSSA
ncbi:hypothetical protein GCM10022381_12880 [Leifsonia kafniensis]|uniref:NERD domain-containing protein n=1 Tax=Leifsonia kafniensis TaxID=475957 RepID=A0ABP7KD94_9MICO